MTSDPDVQRRLVSIPLRQMDSSPSPTPSETQREDEDYDESLPVLNSERQPPIYIPRSSSFHSGERASKPEIRSRTKRDWWMWELIGITTSAVSLGAMIALLLYFDTKPRPEWPLGITLNSILSWTSTLAKSAMLIPISEGLSQMKWIWLSEKERDLQDIQYFEEASRGPWGCFCLLLRLRFRHFGTLGAVVTIAALSLDPTVQLLIQDQTRMVVSPNETAVASASKLYGAYQPGPVLSSRTAPLNMKAATYSGLLSDDAVANITKPNVQCPSGTCNWEVYCSLAVCSTCQNITSQLRNCNNNSCDASLPGGVSLPANTTVMSTNTTFHPVFYKDLFRKAHILVSFQGIAAFNKRYKPSLPAKLSATECMIYLCVNKYRSQVVGGEYKEEIVQSWPNLTSAETTPPETDDGQSHERYINVSNTRYGVNGWTFTALQDHLAGDLLKGSITTKNHRYEFSSDVMQAIWGFNTFSKPIQRLAASMTKVVRDAGSSDDHSVRGEVRRPQVFISVQWGWIALPLFLFAATLIQFGMTIFKTRRSGAGLWRSSALALAFHGFDRETDQVAIARLERLAARYENEDTLMEAVKGMKVRMTRFEDGSIKLTSSYDI